MCSGTYRKAVEEAMGATGVIIEQYREKLDELADRLGLSIASTKLMFQAAVRLRMSPMIEQVTWRGMDHEVVLLSR